MHTSPLRRLAITFALTFATIFVLPFGPVASAHPGSPTLGALGSLKGMTHAISSLRSLTLTSPRNHTVVHLMPTTAWVRQHLGQTSSTRRGFAPEATGPLPSPSCTLATDNSAGDAHVVVNNSVNQYDSLDLSAFGLSSATTGSTTNLTGAIQTQSLSSGPGGTPAVAGGGDIWYIVWNYGTDPTIKGYFLSVVYPGSPGDFGYTMDATTSNLPVDFQYGNITTSPTGGQLFNTAGAATGTFDTAHDRMTVTSDVSKLGSPPAGAALHAAYASGVALVGAAGNGSLQTADTMPTNSDDYLVGDAQPNCPAVKPAGPAPSGLPRAGNQLNLQHFGGPVVHTIKNYLVFWLPQAGTTTGPDGKACPEPATSTYAYEHPVNGGSPPSGALPGGPQGDVDYETILQNYFKDAPGTAFYNLLTQYADQTAGITMNNETLGGTWSDPCGYTSTPDGTHTAPGGTQAAPMYMTDIQNEVKRAIQINASKGWTDGLDHEYFVFTGYGAADCFNPNTVSPTSNACNVTGPVPVYCAYHGDFIDSNNHPVLYANMADGAFAANPSGTSLCYLPPIGSETFTHKVGNQNDVDPIADAEVSITSHEQFETVNDAMVGTAADYGPPLGFYSCQPTDATKGCQNSDTSQGEIGDLCAYKYGHYAGDGSNIVLNGDEYIVQQEYSNWDNGCALTPYQGNGGFGGETDAVTIEKGWNLIGVPVSGIGDTAALQTDMERTGQLPAGSIQALATYSNGRFNLFVPNYSGPITLNRTDGIFALSKNAGTWTPTGPVYTSAATVHFNPGWNLVAATYPNPGIMTDSMYNEIEQQTNACSSDQLAGNLPCASTISEIAAYAGGKYITWTPQGAGSDGHLKWPQTLGNAIPFTSGMWVLSTRAIDWTPQGTQCQSMNSSGVCQ